MTKQRKSTAESGFNTFSARATLAWRQTNRPDKRGLLNVALALRTPRMLEDMDACREIL
jgi:hypothetical protein